MIPRYIARVLCAAVLMLCCLQCGCAGAVSADAGQDQSVQEGQPVTLTAVGGSSAQRGAASYFWEQISGPEVLIQNSTRNPLSFEAPLVDEATVLTFEVRVTATIGRLPMKAFDTVTVTVLPNPAPLASAGADVTVTEGTSVTLNGHASISVEDMPLSYQWIQLTGPQVSLNNQTRLNASFVAPNVSATTHLRFMLRVTAEQDNAADDIVQITVEPRKPTAVVTGDSTVIEGQTATLSGVSSANPSDGPLTFEWEVIVGELPQSALSPDPGAAIVSLIAPEVTQDSALTLRLTVTTPEGAADSALFTLTVQPYPDPLASAGPDQNADEGRTVTLDGSGSRDPAGGTLNYEWTAPGTITLSNSTVTKPVFTAPAVNSNSTLTFTLTVINERGNATTDSVTITILDTE